MTTPESHPSIDADYPPSTTFDSLYGGCQMLSGAGQCQASRDHDGPHVWPAAEVDRFPIARGLLTLEHETLLRDHYDNDAAADCGLCRRAAAVVAEMVALGRPRVHI